MRRGRDERLSPPPFGIHQSRGRSPRARPHAGSRRRSPSPPKDRRDMMSRGRGYASRRDSPVDRRRFLEHRGRGPRSPRRARRERSRSPSGSPRAKYGRRDHRRMERSPPRSPIRSPRRSPPRSPPAMARYERMRRERAESRSRFPQRSRSRSPPLNGGREVLNRDGDGRQEGGYKNEINGDSGKANSLKKRTDADMVSDGSDGRGIRDEGVSERTNGPAVGMEGGKEMSPGFRERSRSPRDRVNLRIRTEREFGNRDDFRRAKRARRDFSPDRTRDSYRQEHRDRRSVHDRLGQPKDRRRSRRSVHDRLG